MSRMPCRHAMSTEVRKVVALTTPPDGAGRGWQCGMLCRPVTPLVFRPGWKKEDGL